MYSHWYILNVFFHGLAAGAGLAVAQDSVGEDRVEPWTPCAAGPSWFSCICGVPLVTCVLCAL